MCVRVRAVLAMCATLVFLASGAAGDAGVISTDQCVEQCTLRFRSHSERLGKPIHYPCCDIKSVCDTLGLLHSKRNSPNLTGLDVNDIHSDEGGPKLRGLDWLRFRMKCRSWRRKRNLREAALIAQSVGMNLGELGVEASGEDTSSRTGKKVDVKKTSPPRNLRVVSQSLSEDSVSQRVKVTWDSGSAGRGLWFLVSWVSEGGALRGNLLTNTSSAALSLLPDTIYHIQVSSSSSDEPSEWLKLDTHPPPSAERMVPVDPLSGLEDNVRISAAILVFLIVCVLLSTRWWLKSSSLLKISEQLHSYDHFKVFPPPVTIHVVSTMVSQSPELLV